MRRGHAADAHLITGAPPNPNDEFDYRRKRYLITMSIRIVCLILAAVTYKIIWLFPIFVVGAMALPWIAVVLANDRLPRHGSRFTRYTGTPARELTVVGSRADATRSDGTTNPDQPDAAGIPTDRGDDA
ncbi:MAG: DUF3099 domain-containing protein [Mycobacteriales bacterium]